MTSSTVTIIAARDVVTAMHSVRLFLISGFCSSELRCLTASFSLFSQTESFQGSNVPTQVGGIPIRMIHQALGIGNSPSQNSISNENSNSPSTAITESSSTPVVI